MRGLNIEMSASREKKQRQVSTANGPSDKQRREMEEAQKARSKTILYTVVGIVIAVLVIALLVAVSALSSISGTYMLKPVINRFILPGDIPGLVNMLLVMGGLYLCGALSCYAYNQMMVHISQKVVSEIRL